MGSRLSRGAAAPARDGRHLRDGARRVDAEPAQLDAVSVFEDASTTMSAAQVAARLADPAHGTPVAGTSSFNVEFSRSAWWIRATLTNRDSAARPLVLVIRDARVDQADFYLGRNGGWTLTTASRRPAPVVTPDRHRATRRSTSRCVPAKASPS